MTYQNMIILVSGLPRAGKSEFANNLENENINYTHIPLDKYIMEIPDNLSFLEWVDNYNCIDWELLQKHINDLNNGKECYCPKPDWSNKGKRINTNELKSFRKLLKPSKLGYVIPGCHSFKFSIKNERIIKIYIDTSYEIIAERIVGSKLINDNAEIIFEKYLSKNWRSIEKYKMDADLKISGNVSSIIQLNSFNEFICKNV